MGQRRLLTTNVSIPEAIVQVLIDAGVQVAFGIPGGLMGPIFSALKAHQNVITTIITRQETLASAMAETTARLTGIPSVLIGQAPWILGYGGVGIIEALLSSSPLLVMTDFSDTTGFSMHGKYQDSSGMHGSWDARTAFSGITKTVMQSHTPVEAVLGTQLALRDCVTGQPGPVAMIYSSSSLAGTIDSDTRPRIYASSKTSLCGPLPVAADLDHAAEMLASAQRGAIIVGNGVRVARAIDQVRTLAKLLDLPVATTATGKGCFPESHELAVGVFGNFGTAVANAAVGNADTILVIGSKLGALDTALEHPSLLDPERQSLIQIDVEPHNIGRNIPVDLRLIGDAKQIIEALSARCTGSPPREASADRVRRLRSELGHPEDASERKSDARPIMPQRLIAELERTLPDDTIVTCDAGENRIFMAHHFQTRGSQQVLMAGGVGPMGYSIPTALAAKRLNHERTVVATTGDGGFGMAMNGLLTGVEYKLGIVVVIFNNAMLGWSSHAGAETPSWQGFDFAAMARAMGCRSWQVSDPTLLGAVLEEALKPSSIPTVLDVAVDATTTYLDVRSPLMRA
jgi:acetolactate synthase I/II/III large subunit